MLCVCTQRLSSTEILKFSSNQGNFYIQRFPWPTTTHCISVQPGAPSLCCQCQSVERGPSKDRPIGYCAGQSSEYIVPLLINNITSLIFRLLRGTWWSEVMENRTRCAQAGVLLFEWVVHACGCRLHFPVPWNQHWFSLLLKQASRKHEEWDTYVTLWCADIVVNALFCF